MKFLFVHNNFPAQFVHVAGALAADPANTVLAIGAQTARTLPGVDLHTYVYAQPNVVATHPFARRFDAECHRAEKVLFVASSLLAKGFVPDVVVVHPGWGEGLPLRSLFPAARIVSYCEYYYRPEGQDVGFDPEDPRIGRDGAVALDCRNTVALLSLVDADAAIAPTEWQKSTFPPEFHAKIEVIHEGVDTEFLSPDRDARLELPDGRVFTARDEVITYAARNLEPLRGYHKFTRALPRILAERRNATVLVIGGDKVSYGRSPPEGKSWKDVFMGEIEGQVDPERIIFTGVLDRPSYVAALRISRCHVYLTIPFVLSWSLMETMSIGCALVVSDTAPVREMVTPERGRLVDFADHDALARAVIEAAGAIDGNRRMRRAARDWMVQNYDLKTVMLPRQLEFLTRLAEGRR